LINIWEECNRARSASRKSPSEAQADDRARTGAYCVDVPLTLVTIETVLRGTR
jgi:hypothetical protein